MSIEMETPQTTLEKADAAHNYINQMHLAHMVKDEPQFHKAFAQANLLLAEIVEELDR